MVSNLEVDMEMVGHSSEGGTLDFVVGIDMNLEGSIVVVASEGRTLDFVVGMDMNLEGSVVVVVVVVVAFVDRVALGFGIGSCLFLSPSLGYYLDCFEVVL